MKKSGYSAVIIALAVMLCAVLLFASACKKDNGGREEKDPAAKASASAAENSAGHTDPPSADVSDDGNGYYTEKPSETQGGETQNTSDAPAQTGENADGLRTPEPSSSASATETTAPTDPQGSSAAPTSAPTSAATSIPKEDIIVAKRQTKTFGTNATVSTNGNTAAVKTASGLEYTASGYSAYSNGRFTINQNFKVTFSSNAFTSGFNRFTLCYTSTQPLKATITYTESGASRADEFFLEAGTDTFSCLIENYLNGKKGSKISAITFSTCEEVNGTFLLCDLSTENYTVYSNDTYYIENDRFKVGVRLLWGGGICYISDKENPVSGLTNLVNQADEGRLIQQSYYGTAGNSEYTPGNFNGSDWAYNPVQGGDKNKNHSRIIDIVVEDYSVYVKAQPQDWSLDGEITPSYMENSYTLYEDTIQVDNRFVDFSGWTHRYADQELPAFYTVSYLDKFTWYDGSEGWTDGALTSRSDLNFWGDPAYHDDCVFPIKMSNTETWCAWTNSSADYGIGLYVPNVDVFLAGKHAYNGSKDPYNGACNYVAPLNLMLMVSYEPIEYSYLITTGSVNEIRSTFAKNKDFASNTSLHKNYKSYRIPDGEAYTLDFSAETNASLLGAENNTEVKYEKNRSALKLRATNGNDVQSYIDFAAISTFYAQNYSKITIEYMIPVKNKDSSYSFELFLCTGSTVNAEAGKSVRGEYIKDGQYHTVEISLAGLSFWSGKVNGIRFDYFDGCQTGDEIFIKSITLS